MEALILFIIVFVLFFSYMMKREQRNADVTYVTSKIDGEKYLVRNLPDKENAADVIATIKKNLIKLTDYLHVHQTEHEGVTQLVERFDPSRIVENEGTDKNTTSYSINKGEKIVLCLRFRDKTKQLVPMNTLMFVSLHEMAHIMTKSIGHTDEFWDNFEYLLKKAIELGIYSPIDYAKSPVKYCGIVINSTPLQFNK